MKNNTCCFTGHRPDKIYGYDMSVPQYQHLAKRVKHVVKILIEKHNVTRFITGGALGFDTIAFFVIESLKKDYPNITNILAIPFVGQESRWNQESVDRYNRMLKLADEVIDVQSIDEYKTSSIGKKMDNRNHYMVDNSNYIIALHDGTKGGTYNCLEYASKAGIKNGIVLHPHK